MSEGCFGFGNSIKTASGIYFDFSSPSIDKVYIGDIATALSKICRFGGQLPGNLFYTVAEHCVHCVKLAMKDGVTDKKILLAILLHDATEAYCGDVVKPLKNLVGEAYQQIEKRVENVIAETFDVDFDANHSIIKKYDIEMLIAEKKRLFNNPSELWNDEENIRVVEVDFKLYSPKNGKAKFLKMYKKLSI